MENQALTEAETWREQQMQLQEQQALQNRAKQEMEAEVERYKQVRWSNKLLKLQLCHGYIFWGTSDDYIIVACLIINYVKYFYVVFFYHRSCST